MTEPAPKTRRRRNPKMIAVWLLLLCALIAELLGYTWVRVQCVRVGYEIAVLNRETLRLTELQDNFKDLFGPPVGGPGRESRGPAGATAAPCSEIRFFSRRCD